MKPMNRTPRPQGLTLLAKEYHNLTSPSDEDQPLKKQKKKTIINHVIKQYVTNEFKLNNQPTTITELSYLLQEDEDSIRIEVMNQLSGIQGLIGKGEEITQLYRALSSRLVFESLSDLTTIKGQLAILNKSQGDQYKAFISSTVNQAISLKMGATDNLLKTLKALEGNPKSVIQIANHNQITGSNPNKSQEDLIGPNEAIMMIDKARDKGLLQDESQQHNLYLNHHLQGLPEVVATKQKGYVPDGAFAIPKKTLKALTSSQERHDNRREEDGPIFEAEDGDGIEDAQVED